jgi:hypothetical protein
MRDDLSDFEGTPEERAELWQAQESVRDWLKRRMLDPEVMPGKKGNSDGIFEKHKVVTPSPSSLGPRYYTNRQGNKSQHRIYMRKKAAAG